MLRTARRLRLEPFEERSLPSAPIPTPHPPVGTAQVSTEAANPADDEASEYTTPGKTATTRTEAGPRTPTSAADAGRALVPDYVVAAYPAAPPMPTGLTPGAPPADVQPAPPAQLHPTASAIAPASPTPPPAPPVTERATGTPPDRRPDDVPDQAPPAPPAGAGDQPAGSDTEFPPVGPVESLIPSFDDLNLQLNLTQWADTASRLLDGLDAVVDPFDGESAWVRLGYWVLAVGTVGLTVELTRQGLRAKQPEAAAGPPLPVTR